MTSIVLIRHGETDWNITGRYQGQADPPLNDHGISQVEELASALEDAGLEILYSSPLKRARQTAEVLSNRLKIDLIIEPSLMEIHQGDWQSRLRSEIEVLHPDLFQQWETQPWEVTPPGGENLFEVQERVYAAMDDMLLRHPAQVIGVVTHRIPIALIKMRYQGLDREILRTIHLPNVYWERIEIQSSTT